MFQVQNKGAELRIDRKGQKRAGDMRDNILAKNVLVNGESTILGT